MHDTNYIIYLRRHRRCAAYQINNINSCFSRLIIVYTCINVAFIFVYIGDRNLDAFMLDCVTFFRDFQGSVCALSKFVVVYNITNDLFGALNKTTTRAEAATATVTEAATATVTAAATATVTAAAATTTVTDQVGLRDRAQRAVEVTKVLILGDSLTRDLASGGVSKLAGVRVEIRSTPGAVPATLRPADLTGVTTLVLHAGTNCLANDDPNLERADATQIAKEVTTKLDELRLLNTDTELIYSSILTRHDIGERDKSKVKIHELIAATNAIIETHCNIHSTSAMKTFKNTTYTTDYTATRTARRNWPKTLRT